MQASIDKLIVQLLALGYPADVKTQVRLQSLFYPGAFELVHRVVKNSDRYQAIAFCVMKENSLVCTHYEVTLRRYSQLPTALVNGVDVVHLDESMKAIDWNQLGLGAPESNGVFDFAVVEDVLQTLLRLADTEVGVQLSGELKLRYWESTPFQKFIGSLPQLKSSIEISQRYFLFDGGEPIKLDEAFRFLNHRWQEKKFQAQTKKASKVTEAPSSGKRGFKKQRSGTSSIDKK